MLLTVFVFLAIAAFVGTICHAIRPDRVPLWPNVLFLAIIEVLRAIPLGR